MPSCLRICSHQQAVTCFEKSIILLFVILRDQGMNGIIEILPMVTNLQTLLSSIEHLPICPSQLKGITKTFNQQMKNGCLRMIFNFRFLIGNIFSERDYNLLEKTIRNLYHEVSWYSYHFSDIITRFFSSQVGKYPPRNKQLKESCQNLNISNTKIVQLAFPYILSPPLKIQFLVSYYSDSVNHSSQIQEQAENSNVSEAKNRGNASGQMKNTHQISNGDARISQSKIIVGNFSKEYSVTYQKKLKDYRNQSQTVRQQRRKADSIGTMLKLYSMDLDESIT